MDTRSNDHAMRVGHSFADLSVALDALPAEVGAGDEGQPWAEIARLVATVASTTDSAAMGRIVEVISGLEETEPPDPWQLVHGDAHRVNVAFDGGEVVWFDFEDANRRPRAWDLATLRRAWPAAGHAACRRLDADPHSESMQWHHELRDVYALLWNLLYGQRYERARKPTTERLAGWLARQ